MATESDSSSFAPPIDSDSTERNAGFCIIEGLETVQDFAQMQLQEIQDNIRSRRNKIFLPMEESDCRGDALWWPSSSNLGASSTAAAKISGSLWLQGNPTQIPI